MNFKRIIVFLYFAFAGSISAQSQENSQESNTNLDKKYTPNQNSIFNILNKKTSPSSYKGGAVTVQNFIKYSPAALGRRKILFYYERNLVQGLSLNIGLGKAIGEDIFQKTYLKNFANVTSNGIQVRASEIYQYSSYSGSNLYVSAGLKFYLFSGTFEDEFLQFSYARETMKYALNDKINGIVVQGEDKIVDFKMDAFNFSFGYNFLTGLNKNLSHEILIGVGAKLISYSKIERVNYSSGPYYPATFVKTNDYIKAKIIPSINLSYCFGFGF